MFLKTEVTLTKMNFQKLINQKNDFGDIGAFVAEFGIKNYQFFLSKFISLLKMINQTFKKRLS